MRNTKKVSKFSDRDFVDSSMEKDIERIVSIFYGNGIIISKEVAKGLWDSHCDKMKKGIWSPLPPKDSEVFSKCEKFLLVR